MMAEYIEREAAITYIKDNQCERCSDIGLCGKCAVLTAIKLFESIPAADVRPVVLCRDCVYLTHDEYGAWCFNNYEANLKDDDFCSHGKRKERLT